MLAISGPKRQVVVKVEINCFIPQAAAFFLALIIAYCQIFNNLLMNLLNLPVRAKRILISGGLLVAPKCLLYFSKEERSAKNSVSWNGRESSRRKRYI